MIVVMPAGHVRGQAPVVAPPPGTVDPFVSDFLTDVVPYVGKHYRVSSGREYTAIAGLSMGGGQTLDILLGQPERFAYVGVFSSGLFGLFPVQGRGAPPPAPTMAVADWEARHAGTLGNAAAKKGLKLFWFSTGKDDFLVKNTEATVDLFRVPRGVFDAAVSIGRPILQ
jgi:enterochelin esterase family protein